MTAHDDSIAFTITRQFHQPLATVWEAWSVADQLKHWWGPQGCTLEIGRFEFRPGGFFHFAMLFEDAPPMWGRFNYREIAPLQRLVWLNSFSNEHCGIARAPFSEVCPLEIENTVTFTEQDGITTVALRAVPFGELPTERLYFDEIKSSMEQGYGGTLDQLGAFLQRV